MFLKNWYFLKVAIKKDFSSVLWFILSKISSPLLHFTSCISYKHTDWTECSSQVFPYLYHHTVLSLQSYTTYTNVIFTYICHILHNKLKLLRELNLLFQVFTLQ